MANKPRTVPTSLDMKKLGEMSEPLTVRLIRKRPGSPGEPIRLPEQGVGWTQDRVRSLEQDVIPYSGGGSYYVQVQNNNGQSLEWEFFHPAKPVLPGDIRVEVEQADANARSAQAHAQAQYGGFQQQPQQQQQQPQLGAPPAWQPGQQAWPGQQQAPQTPPQVWGPPQGAPPQVGWPGQQQPGWQQGAPPPQQYGAPPQAPPFAFMGQPQQQPYGFDQWGRPLMLPPQQPFYSPQQPPFIAPSVAQPGADQQVLAKLQALEEQNARMREERIRAQAEEKVALLTTELRQYQQSADARFNSFMERITTLVTARPTGDTDQTRALEREAQQRREDMARMEHQRSLDVLKVEMAGIADRTRQGEERFRQELAQAKDSNQSALMQQLVQQQQQAQQQSQQQMLALITQFQSRELKPLEMISMLKEAIPGRDPMTEKLLDAAIENMVSGSGGAPSMPQVVGELGRSLIEGAQKVTQAVVEAGADKDRSKRVEDARARQRAAQVEQQAKTIVVAPQQLPSRNGAPQHGAPASQAPAEPNPEDATAADTLEFEERPYWGDTYTQVQQLRKFVEAKAVTADRVASVFCEAWLYFTNMQVRIPALADLGAFNEAKEFIVGDLHRLVTRALPDAPGSFRREVIENIPAAVEGIILDDGEGAEDGEEEAAPLSPLTARSGVPQ